MPFEVEMFSGEDIKINRTGKGIRRSTWHAKKRLGETIQEDVALKAAPY